MICTHWKNICTFSYFDMENWYSEMYMDVKSPAGLVKTQIVRLHCQRIGISGVWWGLGENLQI